VNDCPTAWLPYHPKEMSDLPSGLSCLFWDGSDLLPGDPGDVRFLVSPPVPGAEKALRRLLPHTTHVEVLQLLSSGHDHVLPLIGMLPDGARVSTGRGVHHEPTAELAVTLLLALCRGLGHFRTAQVDGQWRPRTFGTLLGKRVVVVGYGAVGTAVADRLRPFGCEVVPLARTGRTTTTGRVRAITELRDVLPGADAVLLCAPLTGQTRGLLGREELSLMKDGAFLVNVARGELVDTDALVSEVESGRLEAALDVVDPEPLPAGHRFWTLPGVLLTPHVAAFTEAFAQASRAFLGQQLHRFVRGEALENVVPAIGSRR